MEPELPLAHRGRPPNPRGCNEDGPPSRAAAIEEARPEDASPTSVRLPIKSGVGISPGAPLCTASSVVEIAGSEREWDAFMQIGTHSSSGSNQ